MPIVKKPRRSGDDLPFSENGVGSAHKSNRDADLIRKKARTLAKQQQAAERLSAATDQLSSNISEAASAAEELRKSMDQISSGAAEAASASNESLSAINEIAANLLRAKDNAETSRVKTDALQSIIARVGSDVGDMILQVGLSSDRQIDSVVLISELEKQAESIGEIVKAVARIADQTNLLALNAAIEAARAGVHGKGFAVVADEVRTLAETSEKSAREIQELVESIKGDVKDISDSINNASNLAKEEVDKGNAITEQLDVIKQDMIKIMSGAEQIAVGAVQAEAAAKQAQIGSETIASAAEEQSSACEEVLKTIAQQTQSLNQADQASQELTELSEDLKTSSDISKSSEEVATAAEELSATVEELNRAANEILKAIDQIAKGSLQQSSAAEESSSAVTEIEAGAKMSEERASEALEKGSAVTKLLGENKVAIDGLISGVALALADSKKNVEKIIALEILSRRIDKIVESISTVSVQTNMLAVNGSIEAARAGEFGKGFAVVSTDIRNLARDSAENADRIKDLVKSIQDQIEIVRRDLEAIVSAAAAELEKNKGITSDLETIERDMEVVLNGNSEIKNAALLVVTSLENAKKGVDQISVAAEQANKASQQAATAAKQQSQGAEELAQAIEEISALADEMQSN